MFAGDLFRVQSLAEQSKALNAPTFAVQLPLLKAKVKVYGTEVLEIVPVCAHVNTTLVSSSNRKQQSVEEK